jgi:hypothetical protein
MKDWKAIRERYLRDTLPLRLGGLAANLARIKSFSDHPDHCDVVESLLNESKFFIEWTASDARLELQAELVELQLQLACWQLNWKRIWNDPVERAAAAGKARIWSERILEMSALLPQRNRL